MKYWIIINGAQLGPMDLDELLTLNPQPETPVWHEGLPDWVAAASVPAIAATFASPEAAEDVTAEEVAAGDLAPEEAYKRGYEKGYREGAARTCENNSGRAQSHDARYAPGSDPSANRFYSYGNRYSGYSEFGPNPVCPPTYLVGSILVTIFCCTVAGIIGIIYSSLVSRRFAAGDYAGAERASSTAMWCVIISFVVGLVSAPLWFLSCLVG